MVVPVPVQGLQAHAQPAMGAAAVPTQAPNHTKEYSKAWNAFYNALKPLAVLDTTSPIKRRDHTLFGLYAEKFVKVVVQYSTINNLSTFSKPVSKKIDELRRKLKPIETDKELTVSESDAVCSNRHAFEDSKEAERNKKRAKYDIYNPTEWKIKALDLQIELEQVAPPSSCPGCTVM